MLPVLAVPCGAAFLFFLSATHRYGCSTPCICASPVFEKEIVASAANTANAQLICVRNDTIRSVRVPISQRCDMLKFYDPKDEFDLARMAAFLNKGGAVG